MRRYYRGKGKDGIWYDGYYIKMNNDSHYIFSEYNDNKLQEVDKNTITEYTNLYDKNDIEICEGDIVQQKTAQRGTKYFVRVGIVKFGKYKDDITVTENSYYIKYNNQYVYNMYMPICYGWYIQYVKQIIDPLLRHAKNSDARYDRCCGLLQCIQHREPFEIIGNIFDNPELLEL